MKIESNLLNISMSQSDRVQEPLKPDNSSSSRKPSPTAGGDGVELGRQEGFVATARSAGLAERTSVVQYLRGLIQSGQYQVDSAALSESIVTAAQYED
jgi:anti-sigma28 factor (negative regulator of flagellin synthesis)